MPSNRRGGESNMIDVEFFRFRRLPDANPATPPIVLLRGGPGYEGLGDAVNNEELYERGIKRYTRLTDFIIVGQRGFGTSTDTPCPQMPAVPVSEVLTLAERQARERRGAELCRQHYEELGMDMSGFNIAEMAQDVVDITKALGYEQIQLKGNSFGAFWALSIIRSHPDYVARATLAALEGPDHTFDRPTGVKQALEKIAASAEQSDRYQSQMPDDGLLKAYQKVIDAADASPIEASFVDEDTQERITIQIDGDGFRKLTTGIRRPPVYFYAASEWPEEILEVIKGNYAEAARRLHYAWTWNGQDHAAETIIECSSGVSTQRREAIANDPALQLLAMPGLIDDGICDVWGDTVIPMDTSTFSSTVPTVLIHGTWDLATPFENSDAVRRIFSNHHFIEIEGGFHGANFAAEEQDSTFVDSMDTWYATGQSDQLPTQIKLADIKWDGET
ncbi:MAG: alpha/beta fold hydrolase [Gammaproteobacteria bacterium]